MSDDPKNDKKSRINNKIALLLSVSANAITKVTNVVLVLKPDQILTEMELQKKVYVFVIQHLQKKINKKVGLAFIGEQSLGESCKPVFWSVDDRL